MKIQTKFTLLLLALIMSFLFIPMSADAANAPRMTYKGHTYQWIDSAMSWEKAKSYCEKKGGHLVTITSKGEEKAIKSYIKKYATAGDIWIGITDKDSEGDWSHWITGEKVTYTNWGAGPYGTGEPNNGYSGGQNYGVICNWERDGSKIGQWDDLNPSQRSVTLLCEWDNNSSPLKKGTKFIVDNYIYEITNAKKNGSGTVRLYKPVKSTIKKANIPATVKINGAKFKVTSIRKNAFNSCSKLQKVTISKNVTSIGKKAFYNCRKLKTITINSKKLKSVGSNSFKKINSTAKIKVPSSKLKTYKKLLKGKGQGSKVTIKKK